MATFSYAQAAKGQAAPANSTASGTQSSPAVNGQSTNPEDAQLISDGSQVIATKADVSEMTPQTESNDATVQLPEVASSNDGPATAETQSSSASLDGSRREDDDTATEASTRRSEKGAPRSPSSSTLATDDTDAKKGQRKARKGKNGETPEKKGKDTEKEEIKEEVKIELFEAPIPSVNIWAQRKEAQAAKFKAPVARTETSAPAVADSESKKKSKPETVTPSSVQYSTNGARSAKADGDANARRSAPRGSRIAERSGALPPVGDSASWPTPETAIKEDKTKPSDKMDKTDKIELQDENGANKTKRREWERIDFVPTVNWETPIPATRGSRGGRAGPGARGGRDAAARTGQNGVPAQAAEKSAEPVNAAAKINGEQRERTREGGANRANSQPPVAGKTPATDAPRNEQKKAGPPKSGKPRDNGAVSSNEPSSSRGEGRGERGRGGFHRGRGGGHAAGNASAHGQQNFIANGGAFPPQAGGPRGNHYMSPSLTQGGNAFQGYGTSQGRGGRGSNRGQAGGFGSRGNGHNGGSRPRPISTHQGHGQPFPWDATYAGMPLTAPPYPPQQINFEVKALLTQQVEYYFSLDNLCKDDYLRTFMDGQGFVPLSLVRSFHRVSKLCGDNLALLRAACADMTLVDLCMSPDGIERLRSRQHPQAFILPVERRQESARNPGPETYYICNLDQYHNQVSMGMMGVPYGAPAPYVNGGGLDDGSTYINGSQSSDGNGQLSAAVPEFQPGALNGSAEHKLDSAGPNGASEHTEQPLTNGTRPESVKTETMQS